MSLCFKSFLARAEQKSKLLSVISMKSYKLLLRTFKILEKVVNKNKFLLYPNNRLLYITNMLLTASI